MINIKDKSIYFLLASILSLVSAYFIEYILNHKPCVLCVYQRIPYMSIIAFFFISHKINLSNKLTYSIYLVIFTASCLLATYHWGVENQIFEGLEACSGKVNDKIENLQQMKDVIFNSKPSCHHADFTIFSISLAGWNAILSFGLAYMSYGELKRKI